MTLSRVYQDLYVNVSQINIMKSLFYINNEKNINNARNKIIII